MGLAFLLLALLGQAEEIGNLPEREEISETLLEELEALQANPINPNTAPPYELYGIPFLTPDQVARVLTLRKEKPFTSWSDFRRRVGLDPVTAHLLKGIFVFHQVPLIRGRVYGALEQKPRRRQGVFRSDLYLGEIFRVGIRWRRNSSGRRDLRVALLWTPGKWGLRGVALGEIHPLFGLGLFQGPGPFYSSFRPPPGPNPGFLRPAPAPSLWLSLGKGFLVLQGVLSSVHQVVQATFSLPEGELGLVSVQRGLSLWGRWETAKGQVAAEIGRYWHTWNGLLTARQSFQGGRMELGLLFRGDSLPPASRYASLNPGTYIYLALRGKGPWGLGLRVLRIAEVEKREGPPLRSWRGSYLLIREIGAFQVSLALREGAKNLSPRPQIWTVRLRHQGLRCEFHRSGESLVLSGQLQWGNWSFFAHVFTASDRSVAIFEPGAPGFFGRTWISGEGSRAGFRVKGKWGELRWAVKGAWTRTGETQAPEIRLLFLLSESLYSFPRIGIRRASGKGD